MRSQHFKGMANIGFGNLQKDWNDQSKNFYKLWDELNPLIKKLNLGFDFCDVGMMGMMLGASSSALDSTGISKKRDKVLLDMQPDLWKNLSSRLSVPTNEEDNESQHVTFPNKRNEEAQKQENDVKPLETRQNPDVTNRPFEELKTPDVADNQSEADH